VERSKRSQEAKTLENVLVGGGGGGGRDQGGGARQEGALVQITRGSCVRLRKTSQGENRPI